MRSRETLQFLPGPELSSFGVLTKVFYLVTLREWLYWPWEIVAKADVDGLAGLPCVKGSICYLPRSLSHTSSAPQMRKWSLIW